MCARQFTKELEKKSLQALVESNIGAMLHDKTYFTSSRIMFEILNDLCDIEKLSYQERGFLGLLYDFFCSTILDWAKLVDEKEYN